MGDVQRGGGVLSGFKWRLIGLLGSLVIRLVYLTVRSREIGLEHLEEGRGEQWKPVILAFLHGRLLGNCYNNRGQGACVMVSRHKDGELIARINDWLGYTAARGSATRGAVPALKAILRAIDQNRDLAFTVDGPRGPAGVVKQGVAYASARTGRPVVPTAAGYSACWQLNNWDRFQIPKPFSRMVVAYGAPLQVPDEPDGEEIDRWRQRIGRALEEVSRTADLAAAPARRMDSAAAAGAVERFLTRPRNRTYHFPVLAVLAPFELVYRLAWKLRENLFRSGRIKTCRPPVPAVCVGSLFAGGSGKTPLTVHVAARLAARGLRVAVLSRGYGGAAGGGEPVVIRPGAARGESLSVVAVQAGDEAAMIARSLPEVAVVVCPDRAAAAGTAVSYCDAEVLVLDDGFGHRRLERDLDILVFSGSQVMGPTHTFPAGFLREPVEAAGRAGAIAIRGGLLTRFDKPGFPPELPEWAEGKPRLHIRTRIAGVSPLESWREGGEAKLSDLRETVEGKPVVAFCALANPAGFSDLLAGQGAASLELAAWPDHHRYSQTDQRELRELAKRRGAVLVTTEKDAVKLDPRLVGGDTLVVCLGLEERNPAVLDSLLDKMLSTRSSPLDSRER
ncbi:MAG: tetraacyldisaccharide 4'-kinase [Candidatus Glassbacteria bacterium]|nr:tetraacyldisaccharide 4'-kinase [Candidatus Glassbacteria bacterium]